MGFLPRDRAPKLEEEILIKDLWGLIKGDENKGVSFNTL